MASILVTGGLGAIGSRLVEKLLERNHKVLSCDVRHTQNETGFSVGRHTSPKYVRCDIGNFRQIQRLFQRCDNIDVVYNCAAEFGRWNGEDFYEQLWTTNVIGTKNIIRLQELYDFRLVHFSSSEVYGDYQDIMDEAVTEQHAIQQLNDYAMTKWVNEQQIRNSVMQNNTHTVIVRLFNTYGPGEHYSPYRSVNCRFLYSALKGIPWVVYCGHKRSSTYVDDTIRSLANIAERFHDNAVYNIAGEELHSIEDLASIVLEITGADTRLVEYRNPEPMTVKDKRVDTSRAKRDLGHKATVGLREGMVRTLQWMKSEYRT